MILFKSRYCRKNGHDVHPDPGDFVLYCMRCHAMVDMFDLVTCEHGATLADACAEYGCDRGGAA